MHQWNVPNAKPKPSIGTPAALTISTVLHKERILLGISEKTSRPALPVRLSPRRSTHSHSPFASSQYHFHLSFASSLIRSRCLKGRDDGVNLASRRSEPRWLGERAVPCSPQQSSPCLGFGPAEVGVSCCLPDSLKGGGEYFPHVKERVPCRVLTTAVFRPSYVRPFVGCGLDNYRPRVSIRLVGQECTC